MPDFYTRGHGSASSDYTLSSGLSPRDLDGKTHREFDLVEAQNVSAPGLVGYCQQSVKRHCVLASACQVRKPAIGV